MKALWKSAGMFAVINTVMWNRFDPAQMSGLFLFNRANIKEIKINKNISTLIFNSLCALWDTCVNYEVFKHEAA